MLISVSMRTTICGNYSSNIVMNEIAEDVSKTVVQNHSPTFYGIWITLTCILLNNKSEHTDLSNSTLSIRSIQNNCFS